MSLCEPNSVDGSHKDIKAQRSVLPTNNIRAATAERAVVHNLGQMPPATTAFVVSGFGDTKFGASMRVRDNEQFSQKLRVFVRRNSNFHLKAGTYYFSRRIGSIASFTCSRNKRNLSILEAKAPSSHVFGASSIS